MAIKRAISENGKRHLARSDSGAWLPARRNSQVAGLRLLTALADDERAGVLAPRQADRACDARPRGSKKGDVSEEFEHRRQPTPLGGYQEDLVCPSQRSCLVDFILGGYPPRHTTSITLPL